MPNREETVPHCNLCNEENDEQHRHSAIHRYNYQLDSYQQNKSSLRKNRHGVELKIEVIVVNGFTYDFTAEANKKGYHYLNMTPARFKSHGNQVEFKCTIKNSRTRNENPIVITYAGVLHPFQPYSMIDNNNNLDHGRFVKLAADTSYSVTVRLKLDGNHVSNFKIPIYFSIQTYSENVEMISFSMARSIIVAIHEVIQEDIIFEKSPFTSNKWEKVPVIPAKKQIWMIPDEYPIPKHYFRVFAYSLQKDFGDGVLQEILHKLEPGYVTKENYNEFFHILLWLEETCAILGLNCYNMENVNLTHAGKGILELEVPGLAEKRPSVIKGDFIEIKVHNDHTAYQGVIQRVGDKTVLIEGLDSVIVEMVKARADFEEPIEIDVRFCLGRIHYERMHQGVEQVVREGFVEQLFPSERLLSRHVSEPMSLSQNELYDTQMFNNKEQMTAVHKIINNTSKGAPYIVWGPPGTGKTVTIVEAIYHLKKRTKKKILVCAPANAACNMLAQKLGQFCDKTEMIRIMSGNADTGSVHPDILEKSNLYREEDGELVVVPFLKGTLNKFRIVITTLVFAGKFTREYQPDVVFIDEAAQAREPEACCAIGLLMQSKQLVLTGDPMQLGPVVYSKICEKYNYNISILERLMELPLYKNDSQNNFITKLKLNFRSHREILKLPNKLFYDNDLKAVSASANSDPLARTNIYKMIINGGHDIKTDLQGSPIEFCAVLAKERRQGKSPSYFNPREVLVVQNYVKQLTSFSNPDTIRVDPSDIGIVTPYIRQMYKIRELLSEEFPEVEVGTTEAFQGREKRVIIITTVRAQEDLLLFDKKYKLGFVKEPKRFNVAITRAKSKLIIVGNPLVLRNDDKWKQLIAQARDLGTLCGAPFPEGDRGEKEQVTSRFGNFNLKDTRRNQRR